MVIRLLPPLTAPPPTPLCGDVVTRTATAHSRATQVIDEPTPTRSRAAHRQNRPRLTMDETARHRPGEEPVGSETRIAGADDDHQGALALGKAADRSDRVAPHDGVGPFDRTVAESGQHLTMLVVQRAFGLLVPVRGVRVQRVVGDRAVNDAEARVESPGQDRGDAECLPARRSGAVPDDERRHDRSPPSGACPVSRRRTCRLRDWPHAGGSCDADLSRPMLLLAAPSRID